MPPCSNPTKWRTGTGAAFKMFILKPTSVFSGQINQTSFFDILTQLSVDNTSGSHTAVRPGMTILFGTSPGEDNLGRNRCTGATSSLIGIGPAPRGNHDGELLPVNNSYFTVLGQDMRIWAKIPRIADDGTQFKDYVTAYATNLDQLPKANSGGWYANDPDPITGLITVYFDGQSSYDQNDTSLTHDWDFGDGTPGSSASTTPGNVTFPEGFRLVEHIVTSTGSGLSHAEYIPVYNCGLTPEDDPQYITEFSITEHTMKPEGQTISVNVDQDIDMSDFPDGTLCMIWSTEYWADGTSGSINTSKGVQGREHMVFSGWHYTDPSSILAYERGLRQDTTLNLVDAAGKLATLPGFSQIVERNSSPTSWYQVTNLRVNREYIDYLLRWHSTAFDVVDFHPNMSQDYPISTIASEGSNLYDQADHRCRAIANHLTCDREGVLWMLPDPLLLATQDQSDEAPLGLPLPVRTDVVEIDLDEDVWSSVRYTHTRPPKNHWLRGYAIIVSPYGADSVSAISACEVIAPGVSPGQGASQTEQDEQVVINVDELAYRTGNMYASRLNAVNSIFEVKLTPTNNAGIEPAYQEWVTLTVEEDTAAQRGQTFDEERFLPQQVSISYNHKEGTRQYTVTIEQESYGYAAEEVIQAQNSLPPVEEPPVIGYIPPVEVLGGEETFFLDEGITKIAGFNTDGYLYVTNNFSSVAPVWRRTNLSVDGTPLEFVVDAFSPRYLNVNSVVNGWLVTTTDIYRITDIFGTPGASSQFTFSDPTPYRSMDFSFGTQNWGIVSSYYETVGVKAAYTIDGSSWTEVTVTTDYNTGTDLPLVPGCYVSPRTDGLAYITAATDTGTGDTFAGTGYETSDHGATWSLMTNPDVQPEMWLGESVHVPYHTGNEATVYYGALETNGGGGTPGPWEVSFDFSTGQHGWTISGNGVFGNDGTYVAGVGFESQNVEGFDQVLGIKIEFGNTIDNIYEIDVTKYQAVSPLTGGGRTDTIMYHDPTLGQSFMRFMNDTLGLETATYSVGHPLDRQGIGLIISDQNGAHGPHYFYAVTLRGNGTPPILPEAITISKIKKSVATVVTDVSPIVSLESFGLVNQRAIHTCPIDETVVAAIGQGADSGKVGLFVSIDSAGSWTTCITPATIVPYRRVAIAGDNNEIIYIYGIDGNIGYTANQGSTITSKMGNITTMTSPSPAEFVGICGG